VLASPLVSSAAVPHLEPGERSAQRLCMQQYMFHGYSATAAAVGVCSIAHINGALCLKQVVDVPVRDCAARHAVCAAAHVQCKRRWWIWPGGAASDSLQVDVPVLTAARYLWHVRSWCDVSWAVTVVKTRRSHAWSEHACVHASSLIRMQMQVAPGKHLVTTLLQRKFNECLGRSKAYG
jgi:hypothetical protein